MTQHFIIGDHLVTPHPEGQHHGIFVGAMTRSFTGLPTPAGEAFGSIGADITDSVQPNMASLRSRAHAQRLFSREETLTRALRTAQRR